MRECIFRSEACDEDKLLGIAARVILYLMIIVPTVVIIIDAISRL